MEAACQVKEDIAKSFHEGDKVLMVHGGANKAGRFLEVAVFEEGGRKGGLWLLEGREGRAGGDLRTSCIVWWLLVRQVRSLYRPNLRWLWYLGVALRTALLRRFCNQSRELALRQRLAGTILDVRCYNRRLVSRGWDSLRVAWIRYKCRRLSRRG